MVYCHSSSLSLIGVCNFYCRPEISYCIVRGNESKSAAGIREQRLLIRFNIGGWLLCFGGKGEFVVDFDKVGRIGRLAGVVEEDTGKMRFSLKGFGLTKD